MGHMEKHLAPKPVQGTVVALGPVTNDQLRASNIDVQLGDSANLDGFSRLRTSDPDTVFDSTFQYDLQPLLYEQVTANGGASTCYPGFNWEETR